MIIELGPPSLCGWIWQLDCVSLGHWPQGTTPGILSCWHRFSYTAMPTVLWSFTTGCTSEQCKAKSRECERVSLSVRAVFLQLDCAVLCLCLFPSSHLSHDGAGVRVPANKSSRQFSTHSLFSPPLFSDHPWIYQWRKCIFDKDALWGEVYIFLSTHPQIGTKDSDFLVGNLCSAPCIKCLQTCGRFWNMREIVTNCLPTATCQKACCTRSRSQRPFPAPCLQPVLVTWGSCQ